MTMRIPLQPIPAQSLAINLGGQQCTIQVAQKYPGGVFLSLTVAGVNVLSFRLCRDRVNLIRGQYLPFSGNLVFIDKQGISDPDYSGFGNRFQLAYTP